MMFKGSDSQRHLLELIKKRGHLTLNEAVNITELAKTTLREHFTVLEKDGYLTSNRRREGRGRPQLVYTLTEDGHKLFPSNDDKILRELLHYLKFTGHDSLISEFFTHYWDIRYKEIRHRIAMSEDQSINNQIKILENILEEQGFMPEIELTDNQVKIQECNCPFTETIKETRLPCKLEALFFEKILEADLKRVSHIASGSTSCVYELAGKKDKLSD